MSVRGTAPELSLQAQRLPATQGYRWIIDGFYFFLRNAPLLAFLSFGCLALIIAVKRIPLAGPFLAFLLAPVLAVGVMNGCRSIARAAPFRYGILLSGFRQNVSALMTLGGLLFASTISAFLVGGIFDDGVLLELVLSGKQITLNLLRHNADMLKALELPLLLLLPMIMAVWFTPLLLAWDGCDLGRALFFSLIASWRNWRAFLVYVLVIAILIAAVLGIVLLGLNLFSEVAVHFFVRIISLPLIFIFIPTLFASFFLSYCDVFAREPGTDDAVAC